MENIGANHFKMIKQILIAFANGLEKSRVELTAEDLAISDVYFANLCELLEEQGFIRHVIIANANGNSYRNANIKNARITLAGLEYLCGNKHMTGI